MSNSSYERGNVEFLVICSLLFKKSFDPDNTYNMIYSLTFLEIMEP